LLGSTSNHKFFDDQIIIDIILIQEHMRYQLIIYYMLPYLVKVFTVLYYFINLLGIPKVDQTDSETALIVTSWIIIFIPMSWLTYTEVQ